MQEIEIQNESSDSSDRARMASFNKAELEPIVVEAIREHRCLLESDQIIFEAWESAKADPRIPFEQVERLEDECLVRRKKTLMQQDLLSDLLDMLGYIPIVPEGDPKEISPAQAGHDPLQSQRRE